MRMISGFARKHTAGILTFLFLAGDLFLRGANGFSGWSSTWYALDYSIGSGSRLLAGQILHLLKGDYISVSAACTFVRASCLLVCALASILADLLFMAARREQRPAMAVLLAYMASGPFSPRYLWNEVNFGRLDVFLVGALLAGLIIVLITKRFLLQCALTCVVSCAAMLFHQVFFFLFFPVLLTTLLPDVLDGDRIRVKKGITLLCTAGIVAGVFLYLQLFSGVNATDVSVLIGTLSERTELDLSSSALEYEYFHDFFYSFRDLTLPYLRDGQNTVLLLITNLLLFPAVLFLAAFFRSMRREALRNGRRRFLFPQPYLLLLLLFYVPPFLLTVDWNRWIAAFFYGACLTFAVLCVRGEPHAENAMITMSERVGKAPFRTLAGIVWLSMLSPLTARFFIPEAYSALRLIRSLF